MGSKKHDFRIGTSGWSYPTSAEGSWSGIFYPPGKVDELSYYAQRFNTVEINSTFYRPPVPGYAWNWARKTPEDFEFTVKLWQKFTHPWMYAKKTGEDPQVTQEDVDTFRKGLEPLVKTEKLGCLLVQFPPSFQLSPPNVEGLDRILGYFKDYPMAVELRHRTWSDEQKVTEDTLTNYGASLVYIDEPKFNFSIKQDFKPVGPIFYLRMHGRNVEKWFKHKSAAEKYNYLYSSKELDPFIMGLKQIKGMNKKLYVYTNNHFAAKAVANAVMIRYKLDLPIDAPFSKGLMEEYPELKEFPLNVEGEEDLFGKKE
ncbi:MAG: DUF72 domain-containing protein [Candidatus Zixiibacteriota bacterium]